MFTNRVIEEDSKTAEFFKIVSNFIESDFRPLKDAKIVFSICAPTRFDGQTPIPVKCYKFSSNVRDLFQKDFHIEISQDAWKAASKAAKLILLWRGLRTCGISVDENNKVKVDAAGRLMIFLNKPDIDASFYSDEVLKFGSSGSFKALAKTLAYILDKEKNKKVNE